MKLIKNIDISLSLNKGKIELMYVSVDEILKYFKPCQEMVDALRKVECIGFVKAHCFTDEDHDFVQIYKKGRIFDDFDIIHEDVRIYRNYIIPYQGEGNFRFKMMKIDRGDVDGFYKLKDLI